MARLRPAWTYHTGEVKPGTINTAANRIQPFETTPLVVDGVMYLSTPSSRVIALDSETGKELWNFHPQPNFGTSRTKHAHRGVAYWQSEDGRERRILVGTFEAGPASRLIALDARSGTPCREFGHNGSVDLREGIADKWPEVIYAVTSPPAIYKTLAIVGAEVPEYPSHGPSGVVRAFDVRTGKLSLDVPDHTPAGRAGVLDLASGRIERAHGAYVWSIMSVDVERGIVFLPVGSASYDFYGADRKGKDLYANSLVALDAATGKVLWYYQISSPRCVGLRYTGAACTHHSQPRWQPDPGSGASHQDGFRLYPHRRTRKPLFPVE